MALKRYLVTNTGSKRVGVGHGRMLEPGSEIELRLPVKTARILKACELLRVDNVSDPKKSGSESGGDAETDAAAGEPA